MLDLTPNDFAAKNYTSNKILDFLLRYSTMADAWSALMEGAAEDNSSAWSFWIIDQDGVVDKKERVRIALFCADRVKHLMIDQRSSDALDMCQRYIDGEATDEELQRAADSATAAAAYAYDDSSFAPFAVFAAFSASTAAHAFAADTASNAAAAIAHFTTSAFAAAHYPAYFAERDVQMEYLRALPNPYTSKEA